MTANDHTFTFISPYGVVVDIKGHMYEIFKSEGKVLRYEVSNKNSESSVATIPGDWVFVRASEHYTVHS